MAEGAGGGLAVGDHERRRPMGVAVVGEAELEVEGQPKGGCVHAVMFVELPSGRLGRCGLFFRQGGDMMVSGEASQAVRKVGRADVRRRDRRDRRDRKKTKQRPQRIEAVVTVAHGYAAEANEIGSTRGRATVHGRVGRSNWRGCG